MLELIIVSTDQEPALLPDLAETPVEEWREEGQVCAYGYAAGGYDWLHLPGVASYRFCAGVRGPVVAVTQPDVDRELVVSAFERSALPMALQAHGHEVLHASAVLAAPGVIAICGDSGAGKSTLAHVLGLRGYSIWADDAVAWEGSDDAILALPLPFSARLRPPAMAAFGFAAGSDEQAREPAPLSAVVVLPRNRARSVGASLRRIAGAEAFRALLEQGYSYRPGDAERTGQMVDKYLELAARVSVHEARVGEGIEQIALLADRIEELAPAANGG